MNAHDELWNITLFVKYDLYRAADIGSRRQVGASIAVIVHSLPNGIEAIIVDVVASTLYSPIRDYHEGGLREVDLIASEVGTKIFILLFWLPNPDSRYVFVLFKW